MNTDKTDEKLKILESDVENSMNNFKKIEEEGLKNVLKYYDRIHDRLFSFNNILVVGFFAIAKIDPSIDIKNIFIPIANMVILIWIEFKMLNKSRVESQITLKSQTEVQNWGKSIQRTNQYSFLSILSTSIVLAIFFYFLLSLS